MTNMWAGLINPAIPFTSMPSEETHIPRRQHRCETRGGFRTELAAGVKAKMRLMLLKGERPAHIAKNLGVSPSAVRKMRQKMGIEAPTASNTYRDRVLKLLAVCAKPISQSDLRVALGTSSKTTGDILRGLMLKGLVARYDAKLAGLSGAYRHCYSITLQGRQRLLAMEGGA